MFKPFDFVGYDELNINFGPNGYDNLSHAFNKSKLESLGFCLVQPKKP
jgi:hypothetical protein